MLEKEQQKLHHNQSSHTAANAPPDSYRIPIADPLKTEGKPTPDKHHLVDAGDIPRKVSTSAPIATKECVEAEVTEISSDEREKATCNDFHDKSHTNLAERNRESSAHPTCLRFSNKLKSLSTCFSSGWDKLKQLYNFCRSANGCTIKHCAMKLIKFALALWGGYRIGWGSSHILTELGFDPSSTVIMAVIVVACYILSMSTKLFSYSKTILGLLLEFISHL